jgi:hypothetical protein
MGACNAAILEGKTPQLAIENKNSHGVWLFEDSCN